MLQAKIITEPQVREGKWGPYILIKTKVLKTGEDIAIFGKINDEVANSKTRGEIITIAKNGNGKYKIVAPVENKRSSQGLTPVKEIIAPSLREEGNEDYIDDNLMKVALYILRHIAMVCQEIFPFKQENWQLIMVLG